MESSLKKINQSKYELTVELGKEELAGYIKKAEGRISEQAQIDGFRKGKAPKDLLRKKVGDQHILEEALDIALQDSLSRTIEEKDLEVRNVSNLDIKENSASKLLYTAVLTVFPEIKLADFSKLKVKRKEPEVERKEIDDALNILLDSRSKFVAKDGVAEIGNRVEVDFEVTSDGLPIEGGVSKSHPLIIGEKKFIPGFEDELVGMKMGEEKKFSLNAPADYFHKSVAGKKLDFSVKMVTVQNIEKPELNDDFAKGLGNFKDLKELEKNLEAGITEEKRIKEKQRVRLEILSNIFESSKIELPQDMITDKLNGMIAGFDNELHAKGMELSFYLAHLGKTQEDLKKDWQPEAEKQVGFALILHKLAKDKNLNPSPEDINEEVNKTVQSLVVRGQANPENINIEGLKEAVKDDLANERVFEYLESHHSA